MSVDLGRGAPAVERDVAIAVRPGEQITGTLTLPNDAGGFVIFAHGSGSSRFSARNRFVASTLVRDGFGTLLMDLLTPSEERIDEPTSQFRFDIPMLAERLGAATHAARTWNETQQLPIGYFGARTGAAAALVAAARDPGDVAAVVSRGGRPDLAGASLSAVRAPSLFIVGGADPVVLDLNRKAMGRMHATAQLGVVEGATHLFEEHGALEEVARLAGSWFAQHLC